VAEVEQPDDVGVLDALDDRSLAPETRQGLVAERLREQDLERHRPVEVELRRAEHGAEAALPEQRLDAVTVTDDAAKRERLRGRGHEEPKATASRVPLPGKVASRKAPPLR
jgi:hypothetical protein